MSNDAPKYATDLIVGEEVDEQLGGDVVLKVRSLLFINHGFIDILAVNKTKLLILVFCLS